MGAVAAMGAGGADFFAGRSAAKAVVETTRADAIRLKREMVIIRQLLKEASQETFRT
jgi:hypothetical protein